MTIKLIVENDDGDEIFNDDVYSFRKLKEFDENNILINKKKFTDYSSAKNYLSESENNNFEISIGNLFEFDLEKEEGLELLDYFEEF